MILYIILQRQRTISFSDLSDVQNEQKCLGKKGPGLIETVTVLKQINKEKVIYHRDTLP